MQGHKRVGACGNCTGFLCMSAMDLGIDEGEMLGPNKNMGIIWNGICPPMGKAQKQTQESSQR